MAVFAGTLLSFSRQRTRVYRRCARQTSSVFVRAIRRVIILWEKTRNASYGPSRLPILAVSVLSHQELSHAIDLMTVGIIHPTPAGSR